MHALGGDEVLVVAGIPDQRPPGPKGLAEVAGHGDPIKRATRVAERTRSAQAGARASSLAKLASRSVRWTWCWPEGQPPMTRVSSSWVGQAAKARSGRIQVWKRPSIPSPLQ